MFWLHKLQGPEIVCSSAQRHPINMHLTRNQVVLQPLHRSVIRTVSRVDNMVSRNQGRGRRLEGIRPTTYKDDTCALSGRALRDG